MILVSVGTFVRGFDELVAAADAAAGSLALRGLAQIGHSSVVPKHLDSVRFLPEATLRDLLRRAGVVVCHGGMGILGEAMRAGRPIVAVPRRGVTTGRVTRPTTKPGSWNAWRFGTRSGFARSRGIWSSTCWRCWMMCRRW